MAENQTTEFARDYVGIAHRYARSVVQGKVIACRWVRLACQRHLSDLQRKRWDFHFDEWYGNDVCDFIEKLPHIAGKWKTPNIHLEDVQVFLLVAIFGWRNAEGGRRFTNVYIEMARKGAKSTLTAGVALYCLCCENEPGAEVIVGATTGEQAQKVFGPAKAMVEKTPALRAAFGLEPWARSVTCAMNGGYMQPINAKGKTQDGWNPHLGILDELHAHPNRALFDVITSAFGARQNPLRWVITTAGYDTTGVCYEQHQYVRKILEGSLEADHYFGIIFTIDEAREEIRQTGKRRRRVKVEADDPFDEKVWAKANPMLGVTPTLRTMQNYAKDALASPASEGEFKTKRLNVWMNASTAWLNSEQWLACGDSSLSWRAFDGLDCYIGGDLADKDDITALALVAEDRRGRLLLKTLFWLPEDVLKRPEHAEGRAAAPYRTWVKDGHLLLTPGDWVDHNEIERQVRDWLERYAVVRCTFDQFAAAQAMASRLNEDYGADDPIAAVLHKNAANVTDPAKDLEARVRAGPNRLVHDDNPVMNWMASNATVSRRRDETLLPIKESQMSPNKIDGVDAAINGMAPMFTVEEDEGSAPPAVTVL